MKVISAIVALLIGAAQATYHPHPYYHGYNPYAALASLGLYNPYVLPAPQVPYSGTYSYHDGNRPTIVQANNDGYKFPHAVKSSPTWNPWVASASAPASAPVPAPAPVPAAAFVSAPVAAPAAVHHYYGQPYQYSIPQKTVVQANLGGHDPRNYHYYGHPSQPYQYSIPQKTVVQANLGGHDPWNYNYYGHPSQPYPYSIPQKTVVQANLGGHDPWNYGTFYGTGIYGLKYNNYVPAAVPVLRIE